MNYLIIGSGPAGMSAAERLKELDPEASIMITEKEKSVYQKRYLPDYLAGHFRVEKILSKPNINYRKNNIELYLSFEAEKIDIDKKEVMFSNGKRLPYDKLLIAAGTVVSKLDDGIDKTNLDSLTDVENVLGSLTPLDKALVIGAGPSGIQIAVSLAKAGILITIVEKEELLLNRYLNKEQSDSLKKQLENKGIKVELGKDHKNFSNGFRHIFSAWGQMSVSRFTDIEKTEDIFYMGSINGSINYEQAQLDGINTANKILGQESNNYMDNTFSFNFRDLDLSFYGDFNPMEETGQIIIRQKEVYKKLVIVNEKLKGYIFIGESKKSKMADEFIVNNNDITESDIREMLI